MDVVQFQEFLSQLVSLQAQGLDAQHLIDEAKKAGKEEALKELAPVEIPAPVEAVDVEALKAELAVAKEEKDKALSDDVSDKEKIAALEAKCSKYEDLFTKFDALLHPVVVAPVEPVV